MKSIEEHQEAIEDLLDGIIAKSRKNEEKVPLSKVISNFKKAGKLTETVDEVKNSQENKITFDITIYDLKYNLMNKYKIRILTGTFTFLYCAIPVIQFLVFDSINDRFNDHFFLKISMIPFAITQFIYTNSIIPFITQFVLWIVLWFVVNMLCKLFIKHHN